MKNAMDFCKEAGIGIAKNKVTLGENILPIISNKDLQKRKRKLNIFLQIIEQSGNIWIS